MSIVFSLFVYEFLFLPVHVTSYILFCFGFVEVASYFPSECDFICYFLIHECSYFKDISFNFLKRLFFFFQ